VGRPIGGYIEQVSVLLGFGTDVPYTGVEVLGLADFIEAGQNGRPFLLCDELEPGVFQARQWQRSARQPGLGQVLVCFPNAPIFLRRFPRRAPGGDWEVPQRRVMPSTIWESEYRPAAYRPIAGSRVPPRVVRVPLKKAEPRALNIGLATV
jgi:hypothetical protein